MELNPIYSGETVAFTIDLDTSLSDTDYALAGTLTFTLGTEGSGYMSNAATVTYNATTGVVTVTYSPVPTLPSGVYPWQLVTANGALLAIGTVPVGALISSASGTVPTVTITVDTDTYLTVAQADALLAKRLDVDSWRTATTDDRTRALAQATSNIDACYFVGWPATSTQALQFPRIIPRVDGVHTDSEYYSYTDGFGGVLQTAVPDSVKLACALEASALLDGMEASAVTRARLIAQGVTSIGSDTRSESYGSKRTHMASPTALSYLRDFIAGSVRTV